MATAFRQVADNAISSTITNLSTAGVTSITLASGDGAKFPQPGNGFWLTLWDNTVYPNNPGADPNMEKVTCSARSTDTLTISATTKTHPANGCTVALLDVSQNVTDLQTAVNDLEAGNGSYPYEQTANKGVANGYASLDGSGNVPLIELGNAIPAQTGNAGKFLTTNGTSTSWGTASSGGQSTYTAIVAPSGGDYTTLSAALAAVAAGSTIYIMPGSYTEAGGTFSQANLTIVGAGDEAVLMTLAGNLTLSGNYLKLSGVTIDGGASYATKITGQWNTVSYNHIKGQIAGFFSADYYYNGYFYNKFEATSGASTMFFGPRNRIVGNHIITPHNSAGSLFIDANATFSGNFVYYQSVNSGGGPLMRIGGEFAVVTGNSFYCGNGAVVSMDFRDVFSGNSIFQAGGTVIQADDGCTVSGNVIDMNFAGTGIFLNSSSGGYGASVVGNAVTSASSLSGAIGIGVNSGTHNIVNGNSISNLATGVNIASGVSSTILTSNAISSYTTAISDSGTGTVNVNNVT